MHFFPLLSKIHTCVKNLVSLLSSTLCVIFLSSRCSFSFPSASVLQLLKQTVWKDLKRLKKKKKIPALWFTWSQVNVLTEAAWVCLQWYIIRRLCSTQQLLSVSLFSASDVSLSAGWITAASLPCRLWFGDLLVVIQRERVTFYGLSSICFSQTSLICIDVFLLPPANW